MSTTSPFPSFTKLWHNSSYPAISPSRPELSAEGKNVVLTGGGCGIAARAVRSFASAGATNIGILGRIEKAQSLRQTQSDIERDYPNLNVYVVIGDVTRKVEVDRIFSELVARVGQLHILVNIAGFGVKDPLIKDVDPEDWMRSIEVNVKGSLIVASAFVRSAVHDAVVINVSSFMSCNPAPYQSAYVVSKAAAVVLFDTLQVENPELRVVNLHPGTPARDDASLPGDFMVWLASPEATFAKGKYFWANWDVDEMKARSKEIADSFLLKTMVGGWLFGISRWAERKCLGRCPPSTTRYGGFDQVTN